MVSRRFPEWLRIGNRYRSMCYGDDEVYILVYEPQSNSYLKGPANVRRAQEACIIPVPEEFYGKSLHVYLFCISTDGKVSSTTYGGEAIVC